MLGCVMVQNIWCITKPLTANQFVIKKHQPVVPVFLNLGILGIHTRGKSLLESWVTTFLPD